MRWDDFRRSSNVEDERSASGGGGFNMPGGAGGLDARGHSFTGWIGFGAAVK